MNEKNSRNSKISEGMIHESQSGQCGRDGVRSRRGVRSLAFALRIAITQSLISLQMLESCPIIFPKPLIIDLGYCCRSSYLRWRNSPLLTSQSVNGHRSLLLLPLLLLGLCKMCLLCMRRPQKWSCSGRRPFHAFDIVLLLSSGL